MRFELSRIKERKKYEVIIERAYMLEQEVDMYFFCDGFWRGEYTSMDALKLGRMCRDYNSGYHSTKHCRFDSLFPEKFRDLARVIGVTNVRAHYFAYYSSNTEYLNRYILNSLETMKGTVFVDWVSGSTPRTGRYLRLIDGRDNKNEKAVLKNLYEEGKIFRLDYEVLDVNGCIYCIYPDIVRGNLSFDFTKKDIIFFWG